MIEEYEIENLSTIRIAHYAKSKFAPIKSNDVAPGQTMGDPGQEKMELDEPERQKNKMNQSQNQKATKKDEKEAKNQKIVAWKKHLQEYIAKIESSEKATTTTSDNPQRWWAEKKNNNRKRKKKSKRI